MRTAGDCALTTPRSRASFRTSKDRQDTTTRMFGCVAADRNIRSTQSRNCDWRPDVVLTASSWSMTSTHGCPWLASARAAGGEKGRFICTPSSSGESVAAHRSSRKTRCRMADSSSSRTSCSNTSLFPAPASPSTRTACWVSIRSRISCASGRRMSSPPMRVVSRTPVNRPLTARMRATSSGLSCHGFGLRPTFCRSDHSSTAVTRWLMRSRRIWMSAPGAVAVGPSNTSSHSRARSLASSSSPIVATRTRCSDENTHSSSVSQILTSSSNWRFRVSTDRTALSNVS
jgi:hypothetical protein